MSGSGSFVVGHISLAHNGGCATYHIFHGFPGYQNRPSTHITSTHALPAPPVSRGCNKEQNACGWNYEYSEIELACISNLSEQVEAWEIPPRTSRNCWVTMIVACSISFDTGLPRRYIAYCIHPIAGKPFPQCLCDWFDLSTQSLSAFSQPRVWTCAAR